MNTLIINQNGNEVCYYPDEQRFRRYYYCKDEDVSANADGSYKIADTNGARDANIAYTKDTKRVFMYDEDISAWWEQ